MNENVNSTYSDAELTPSNYKILIVDDVKTNVLLLQTMMKRAGYGVVTATSGEEAIERIPEEKPDLILLDVMMPGMNGFEVSKKLKQNAETKEIPIIFVTALSDPKNIVEGFEHGGNDYVSKPFNMSEIMTRIRHQLALVASRRIILRQNEALQKAIRDRDELYSVIAHDLRSPLGSMKMSLDMLVGCVGKEQVGEDMFELLVSTGRTADELFTLLDNLLKWTKTHLGRLNVVKQHFLFTQMVAGVVDNMMPLAKMSNIDMRYNNYVGENCEVYADIDMMKTIVRNLIMNAIKFSYDNGTISVNVMDNGGKAVVCEVKDTGIGISNEKLEALRNDIPFTSEGTRKEQGSGLGLQLCRNFVQMNGGSMWIESEHGKGSSFYFSIPYSTK